MRAPKPLRDAAAAASTFGPYELGRRLDRWEDFDVYEAKHKLIGRTDWLIMPALSKLVSPRDEVALLALAKQFVRLGPELTLTLHEVVREGDRMALSVEAPAGTDLIAYAKEVRSASLEERVAVMTELVSEVARIHRMGLVHGYLSPRWIRRTAKGFIFLRFHLRDPNDETELETPRGRYNPPSARGERLSPPWDVFSLGVVIAEFCFGVHPFDPGGRARDLEALVGRLEPNLPVKKEGLPIGTTLRRALAPLPEERYPDAQTFLADLVHALGGKARLEALLADVGRAEGRTEAAPFRFEHELRMAGLTALFGVIALGVTLAERGGDGPVYDAKRSPGSLQILARPWANVTIDGEDRDVTPMLPIPVPAGSHTVILRHPKATPVTRTVQVRPGETVTVDVDMPIIVKSAAPVDPSP